MLLFLCCYSLHFDKAMLLGKGVFRFLLANWCFNPISEVALVCLWGKHFWEKIRLYTSISGENAWAGGMFDFGIMVPITHLGIPYRTLRLSLLLLHILHLNMVRIGHIISQLLFYPFHKNRGLACYCRGLDLMIPFFFFWSTAYTSGNA